MGCPNPPSQGIFFCRTVKPFPCLSSKFFFTYQSLLMHKFASLDDNFGINKWSIFNFSHPCTENYSYSYSYWIPVKWKQAYISRHTIPTYQTTAHLDWLDILKLLNSHRTAASVRNNDLERKFQNINQTGKVMLELTEITKADFPPAQTAGMGSMA